MNPIALPLFTGLLLLPRPDIVPEGMRGIAIEARIDAKALAAGHCLAYVVQKGDTLHSIARTQFGDLSRAPEIEKLNPLVEPDRLRIGELLWLPPRDAAAAKQEPVFAYLDTQRPIGHGGKPLVDGSAVTPSRYGGIGIYLVPLGARDAFRQALDGREDGRRVATTKALQELVASGKVVDIDGRAPGRLVRDGDPTQKRADTYIVEKGNDGRFTLRVTSVAYDKEGKPIDAGQSGTAPEEKGKDALLLLLAALGLGLVLRTARARRQPAFA